VAEDVERGPALADGTTFREQVQPWGTVLSIGPVRFRIAQRGGAKLVPGASASTRNKALAVGIAALSLAVSVFLRQPSGQAKGAAPHHPPQLFEPHTACPLDVEPRTHAGQTWRAARARFDRYAFDRGEGVRAISLFGEAIACFSEAGNQALAATLETERSTIVREVEGDYLALRVGLERALASGKTREAMRSVRGLRALVAHVRDTAYADKLERLERILAMQEKGKR